MTLSSEGVWITVKLENNKLFLIDVGNQYETHDYRGHIHWTLLAVYCNIENPKREAIFRAAPISHETTVLEE